jgi:hypothetical protein
MRLRPSLLLLGALICAAGTARAVDHGQFQDVPNDIRAWFKGVRSPDGVPCCDIPTDSELSTTRGPEATGYQSTAFGGGCRRGRAFETPVIR